MKTRNSFNHLTAFTLVELLVVIAIIGVLIALLLPAVQAAREAARRMQCTNKMKQMGIAVHNYHDVQQAFPPGKIYVGDPADNRTYLCWGISILPFIEQQSMFDLIHESGTNGVPCYQDSSIYAKGLNSVSGSLTGTRGIERAVATTLDCYLCPSDAGAISTKRCGAVHSGGGEWALSSYRGFSGRYSLNTWDWSVKGCGFFDFPDSYGSVPNSWRGLFHMVGGPFVAGGTPQYGNNRSFDCETFASMTDGTSNTNIFTEHPYENHGVYLLDDRKTNWAATGLAQGLAAAGPFSSTLKVQNWAVCDAGVANGWVLCQRASGSWHPGGINVAKGDASVTFVSETINGDTWAVAAAVGDGDNVALP